MNVADLVRPVALVTGASSGIGREYARSLAKRGYDLVLVARDEVRLHTLARELYNDFGAGAVVLVADLSREAELLRVETAIRQARDLRFLVNNAGFLTNGLFEKVDVGASDAMVRVHMLAPVRLMRAAIPVMRGNGGRCAIVNVSSVAAFGGSSGNALYCATKAFLNSFTRSLELELRGSNIAVQALCPGYTRTEIHERAGFQTTSAPETWWLTPEQVVEESFRGLSRGKVVTVPGMRYKVIVALSRFVPAGAKDWVRSKMNRGRREEH